MAEKVFDRETLLDLTVNVIPLGILLFFFLAFVIVQPWGFDLLMSGLQLGIIAVTGVSLVILTYFAGKAVSTAETEMERREGENE